MKKRTKQKDGYYVKVPRFDQGGFTDWLSNSKNIDTFNQGAQLAASGANMLQPVNGDSNAAIGGLSGALSGAGTGAKLGATFGPEGALIGAGVGLVGGAVAGVIGGGKKHAAYERRQTQNTQNAFFGQRSNMMQANQDMYGGNYALGDMIGPGDPKSKYNITQTGNLPTNNDPYWKANPLMTQHDPMVDDSTPWGYKIKPFVDPTTIKQALHPQYPISDKQAGLSNTYYPAQSIPVNSAIPTIHKSAGYYADGDQVIDGDNVNTQDDPQFQEQRSSKGQPTVINVEKGELRIDAEKGKILQEYKGINPLSGGLFESHSKDGKDPIHNITKANEGDFIITKKRAKQYKQAVDDNDQIAKDTILMNIRNNKIANQGGLQPKKYADGDQVVPYNYQLPDIRQFPTSNIGIGSNQLTNTIKPYNYTLPTIGDSTTQGYNHKDNFGDTLSKYGPSIFNIGQGLFGKTNLQPQGTPTVNPYLTNIQSNMPKNISYDPLISEANAQSNLAVKDLQNRTNNAGVYRANRQAISSNTSKNITNIKMQTAEANNNIARQRAGIYEGLGEQSVRDQQQLRNYNFGINETNNRALAAKQNYLNTGISQLQQTYMNDKTNSQKENMDKYQIELLKQIYPSISPYGQFDSNYVLQNKYR